MGLLLDMTPHSRLRKSCTSPPISSPIRGSTPLKLQADLLSEKEYRDMREKYEDDFQAGMGAEAIKKLLEEIDLRAALPRPPRGTEVRFRPEKA